ERRLGLHQESLPETAAIDWLPVIVGGAVVILLGIGIWQLRRSGDAGVREPSPMGAVVRRVRSGDIEIALLSPTGSLHTGRNAFTFEFQRCGKLIDVGTVRATGNMPMP